MVKRKTAEDSSADETDGADEGTGTEDGPPLALLGRLKDGRNDAAAVQQTLQQLHTLCDDSASTRILLGCAGACEAVVTIMQAHENDSRIQQQSAVVLKSLCCLNPINAKKAVNGGACQALNFAKLRTVGALEALAQGMRAHLNSAEVQRVSAQAIMKLCAYDSACQTVAGDAGACQAVIAGMQAHAADAEVLLEGAWALTALTDGSDANCARIGSGGGCETLVAAMRAVPNAAQVQHFAMTALLFLCWHSDDNGCTIVNTGGVAAMLTAMQMHAGNAVLQQRSALVIATLAREDSARAAAFGSLGVCEAMLAAMRTSPDATQLHMFCTDALRCLCEGSADNVLRIGAVAGWGTLLDSLRAHVDCVCAQHYSPRVLALLCAAGGADACYHIVAAGGCEAVTASMRAHMDASDIQHECAAALAALDHPRVLRSCLTALRVLCERGGGNVAAWLGAAGACAAAAAAMHIHFEDDAAVQELGGRAVAALCTAGTPNGAALRDAGACEALVACMHTYPGNAELHRYACDAMRRLGRAADANAARLREAGAMEAAAAAHRAALATATSAAQAVASLSGDGGDDVIAQLMNTIGRMQQEAFQASSLFNAQQSQMSILWQALDAATRGRPHAPLPAPFFQAPAHFGAPYG
ncbi:armadillo-type protein [Tribonema minus]|uniref:Armadillo-type protein n=1 Tax=Tribonema minus TaxID=303371 RepID=A0A835YR10_9STRA|nr:armadillo-type protein [Tribonema minus]